MRILLINPSGGPEAEYGALSKASSELPQLGLAAIATVLTGNGHYVRICDYHIQHLNSALLTQIIKEDDYKLVGFSVYITSVKKMHELAQEIRKEIPSTKICVGGPEVTLHPHDFQVPYIDYVFIGEADRSIVDVVNFIANGGARPDTKGVLYNNGRHLEGNSELNLIDDLDSLPLLELDKFYNLSNYHPAIYQMGKKIINIIGSRGCPFKCSFCAAAEINGRKLRHMSTGRFVDYIELYINKGYDSFAIYDDTFTVNRKRSMDISKEIIRRGLKVLWNCWSRVDCVDRETVSYMKDAGCYLMVFGCESMNNKTLSMLRKGFTAEQSLEGIELVKQAGMLTVSSFMMGLPGETADDLMHTIRTVNRTRLDFAIWPIFEPYKGTPIYELCKNEGRWIRDPRFRNAILLDQEEIWEPYSIKRETIERLSQYAFRTFYFRPYFVTSFLKIFTKLPVERKIRVLDSGLNYFVYSRLPFRKRQYYHGSRYR